MLVTRLIHDCVRETMLYLEKNLSLNDTISSDNIKLKDFSIEDVQYTCAKLTEAGYIKSQTFIDGSCIITDITYNGHIFLDNIRDNNIWKETKSKISKLASVSLPVIQQVAAQLINVKLGI